MSRSYLEMLKAHQSPMEIMQAALEAKRKALIDAQGEVTAVSLRLHNAEEVVAQLEAGITEMEAAIRLLSGRKLKAVGE